VFNNRGNLWARKKEFGKAMADFNEAIRLDKTSVSAFCGRAVVWENMKEYDKAIADLDNAIRLGPQNVFALNIRGSVFRKSIKSPIARRDDLMSDVVVCLSAGRPGLRLCGHPVRYTTIPFGQNNAENNPCDDGRSDTGVVEFGANRLGCILLSVGLGDRETQ